MPKERTGSIRRRGEKLFAVVTYTDEKTGKRKYKEKLVKNESEANRQIRAMLNKIDDEGTDALAPKRKTFRELAERYKKEIAIPYDTRGGKKNRGLKSYKIVQYYVDYWTETFGDMKLHKITPALIEEVKNARLDEPIETEINVRVANIPSDGSRRKWRIEKQKVSRSRSVAATNRELCTLRRMLTFAKKWKWLNSNPFDEEEGLIKTGDEVQRERILSRLEEIQLTKAVEASESKYLKVCFYFAIDCGLRKGEMLKMIWKDVDLVEGCAVIQPHNSKTGKGRRIFFTERLLSALEKIRPFAENSQRVIGLVDFKRSWQNALSKAGIEDFRWHDLRHDHASKALASGASLPAIQRQLGHSSLRVTERYLNLNDESGRSIAKLRDMRNAETENEKVKLEIIEANATTN